MGNAQNTGCIKCIPISNNNYFPLFLALLYTTISWPSPFTMSLSLPRIPNVSGSHSLAQLITSQRRALRTPPRAWYLPSITRAEEKGLSDASDPDAARIFRQKAIFLFFTENFTCANVFFLTKYMRILLKIIEFRILKPFLQKGDAYIRKANPLLFSYIIRKSRSAIKVLIRI